MFATGFFIFCIAAGIYGYHDVMGTTYKLQDGTMRLIARIMGVGGLAMVLSAAVKLWDVMP